MRKSVLMTAALAVLVTGALALAAPAATAGDMEVYPMGKDARVGDLAYRVDRAWWETVPNPDGTQDEYLGVELAVTNRGKQRIQIPPFQLIDAKGRPHEVNYSRIVWPKMAVNPGETITGTLYFHLPRGEGFRLLISGGYKQGEFAHVEISEIDGGA